MFSCGIDGIDGNNGVDGNNGTDGTNGVGGGKIYDANDIFLGDLTSASPEWLTIFTSNGYFASSYWDKFSEDDIHFTGPNGSGELFIIWECTQYSKRVIYSNNQFYTFKITANGLSVADESITTYSSYWDGDATSIVDSTGSLNASYEKAYLIETISRADIGLPETIAYPLRLEY